MAHMQGIEGYGEGVCPDANDRDRIPKITQQMCHYHNQLFFLNSVGVIPNCSRKDFVK